MDLLDDNFTIILMLVIVGLLIWVQALRHSVYKACVQAETATEARDKAISNQESLRQDFHEMKGAFTFTLNNPYGLIDLIKHRSQLLLDSDRTVTAAQALYFRSDELIVKLNGITQTNSARALVIIREVIMWLNAVDELLEKK